MLFLCHNVINPNKIAGKNSTETAKAIATAKICGLSPSIPVHSD